MIALPGRSEVIALGDIARVERGTVDPPTSMLRSSGVPALGIGVSMRDGGNIVRMGEEVSRVVRRLQGLYPIGIEFDFVAFQPREVTENVDNFIRSLLQAVGIVVLVMLLFLGVRTGLVVATLIPMTMFLSMALMNFFDVTLNTVSYTHLRAHET